MSLDDAWRRADNRTYVRSCVRREPNWQPFNFRQATARCSTAGGPQFIAGRCIPGPRPRSAGLSAAAVRPLTWSLRKTGER
jgi:hypothetical protein